MTSTATTSGFAAILMAAMVAVAPAQTGDDDINKLTFEIADALYNRGNALLQKKAYDRAISDYTEAIAYYPTPFAGAYVGRGNAFEDRKEYTKAQSDFTKATQIDPKMPHGFNNLAWLLATCPDAKIRDGKKAVALAAKACELSDWKDALKLDTLAAAHAEAGQFDDAVKWQGKAVDISPKEEREERRARLELYKDKKVYHRK